MFNLEGTQNCNLIFILQPFLGLTPGIKIFPGGSALHTYDQDHALYLPEYNWIYPGYSFMLHLYLI